MTDIALLLLQSLWFIAPAYAANGFPPLMQGTRPLDGRRIFRKQRLFGDGKTWEGTVGGIIVGMLVGMLQITFQSQLGYLGLDLPVMTMPLVIALTIGTMAGDVLGSFIKRRLGIKRGGSAPLLDQEGFLVMAFVFAAPVYQLNLILVAVLLIITPPIHWLTNVIGYYMKFKKTPW
ncbi:MAG: CDP-2,3-bis-(O-geranylgeranyl)-sn-glycerol synthase [Candidatus Aenigmarchaeota archaeon]|nr:CDP-2,3-bis-(O-geranylgeranyl)-sn-glycerol synthase [Candidatus Aenigmarchaeota archaeon]